MMNKPIIHRFLSQLLPATCLLCHLPCENIESLCNCCAQSIPPPHTTCSKCGLVHRQKGVCKFADDQICYFDQLISLGDYSSSLANLIRRLKFQQCLVSANILASRLHGYIVDIYAHQPLPEVLIPIPLHSRRLAERGYNQALEIARPLSKQLAIPINLQSYRQKPTAPQTTLDAKQRRENLENAFQSNVTDKHVAIVDDVVTTTSTVNEFSRVLRKNGVRKIDVWCIARAN